MKEEEEEDWVVNTVQYVHKRRTQEIWKSVQ
jgi:hypothetical protein